MVHNVVVTMVNTSAKPSGFNRLSDIFLIGFIEPEPYTGFLATWFEIFLADFLPFFLPFYGRSHLNAKDPVHRLSPLMLLADINFISKAELDTFYYKPELYSISFL